jgi:hypothetical protein
MLPSGLVDRLPSSPKYFALMFQRMFSTGLALRDSGPQGFHFPIGMNHRSTSSSPTWTQTGGGPASSPVSGEAVNGVLDSGMVRADCSSRGSLRLNHERRYHDWKRSYGKDEAVSMRKSYYGSLVVVGVLSCLEVFFVLCGCIARQGNTDAYGAYDKFLHGFWGNQLNCGKLMPFLEGKASILFHCQTTGPVVPPGERDRILGHDVSCEVGQASLY